MGWRFVPRLPQILVARCTRFAYHLHTMTGSELLADWMNSRGLNQREAADELGLHWTQLNKILLETRRPGLATAVAIERVTGIPVKAWMPTDVGHFEHAVASVGRKRRIVK